MRKIREVVFNAAVYRLVSVAVQLMAVSLVFGIVSNWRIVVFCNVICFVLYVAYHMMAIRIRRGLKNRVRGRVKVYLSHPIRGSKVDGATKNEQMSNSARAQVAANELRKAFPELDIYCPGDAEKFVHHTYANGWLTDAQILEIDCMILDDCDCMFAYDFDTSKGVQIEKNYASEHGIPVLSFKKLDAITFNRIRVLIDELTD